jgi:hypothetical protein
MLPPNHRSRHRRPRRIAGTPIYGYEATRQSPRDKLELNCAPAFTSSDARLFDYIRKVELLPGES